MLELFFKYQSIHTFPIFFYRQFIIVLFDQFYVPVLHLIRQYVVSFLLCSYWRHTILLLLSITIYNYSLRWHIIVVAFLNTLLYPVCNYILSFLCSANDMALSPFDLTSNFYPSSSVPTIFFYSWSIYIWNRWKSIEL